MNETQTSELCCEIVDSIVAGDGSVIGLDPTLPIVVSYGLGVDSTAVLVGLYKHGIRPDAILFADVGSEQANTYAYLKVINTWLRSVGFPEVTVVRYQASRFKHAYYETLDGNCLANRTLPSLAFGMKGCSLKWKAAPLDKYVDSNFSSVLASGRKVQRLIGYDCSAADNKRFAHAQSKDASPKYTYFYPLQNWQISREGCMELIRSVGLPVPPKSSCFFCPAMKQFEVLALSKDELRRIVAIEHVAAPNLKTVVGLWRSKRMTDFILEKGLLTQDEVDEVKAMADQDRMQFAGKRDLKLGN